MKRARRIGGNATAYASNGKEFFFSPLVFLAGGKRFGRIRIALCQAHNSITCNDYRFVKFDLFDV